MDTFHITLIYPDDRQESIAWLDGVPLPGWGETFVIRGKVYIIADAEWQYTSTLAGCKIHFLLWLSDDDSPTDVLPR